MRVLLASSHGTDPAYGGAERYVRDLVAGLTARGHEVALLAAFPQGEDPGVRSWTLHASDWRESPLRRLRNHVGDVVSMPWPRLGRALDELRPDVVHTSNLPGIATGIWEAARRRGIPVVHTLHDYHLLCPRTSLLRRDGSPCRPSPLLCGARTRRLVRWSGAVGHVIAGSEHLLAEHRAVLGRIPQRVIRLPRAPLGSAVPPPPGTRPAVLGYLGALTEAKGVAMLLEAFPRLADLGFELRIAGDGPLRGAVEGAGARYSGVVEGQAKLDFLAAADIGLVPSLWAEPSGPPYVVLEWLAARRPVLTTRHGGLAESATAAGVVSFDGTAQGLAGALAGLGDPGAWDELTGAVPEVTSDADVERWLDEHESVYRALVSTRVSEVSGAP